MTNETKSIRAQLCGAVPRATHLYRRDVCNVYKYGAVRCFPFWKIKLTQHSGFLNTANYGSELKSKMRKCIAACLFQQKP